MWSLLQPLGGPVVYLSDLEPLDYLHLPFLSIPWSYGRDRNVLGGELQVAGTSYAKGLGMHSTARLAYTLDGAYERFDAQLAIDDAAGQGGSVVFRVLVDRGGRWDSEFQSPIVRGGDAPQPCSVNLQGAARLALVVDFADRADQQDHADWLDARLIRARDRAATLERSAAPRRLEHCSPRRIEGRGPRTRRTQAPYFPSRRAFANARVIRCLALKCPSPPLIHSRSLNACLPSGRQQSDTSSVGTGCQLWLRR